MGSAIWVPLGGVGDNEDDAKPGRGIGWLTNDENNTIDTNKRLGKTGHGEKEQDRGEKIGPRDQNVSRVNSAHTNSLSRLKFIVEFRLF